jgi:hypothetical protein
MPFVRKDRFIPKGAPSGYPESLKVGALAARGTSGHRHRLSRLTPTATKPRGVFYAFTTVLPTCSYHLISQRARAGMMCRFHFGSCLLLVFCYLVASFEPTTATGVRRSAACMPTHFRCARWTFELTLESDLQQHNIFNHRKR